MALQNKKSLGQHWLKNREILDEIAELARGDAPLCLEIGPGLGFLTSSLLKVFPRVLAVEFDEKLAKNLPNSFPGKNLVVVNADFLDFDLENGLNSGFSAENTVKNAPKTAQDQPYVVASNIPYYITTPIISKLLEAKNRPKRIVLLVQKEVAERIVAGTSYFSNYVQNLAEASLGPLVNRELFTPPPKVDSQVLILVPRGVPLISAEALNLAKRAFSAPRKKLVKNLSPYYSVDSLKSALLKLGLSPDARAADLSLLDWQDLADILSQK